MKKGCFITTVFFGTILIGILFYIGDKYGDKIVEYFEGRVVDLSTRSSAEVFDKITDGEYKDSLLVLWKDVEAKAKDMEFQEGIDYVSSIVLKIDNYAKDSLLTSDEFRTIKKLIENEGR